MNFTIYNSFEKNYSPKKNAIGFIRLILAIFVVIQHSFVLNGQIDPLSSLGLTSFGALGVDSFFILSGFLITASWLNSKSFLNYIWHRILRIFPAFWFCLVFTALIVAPVMALISGQIIDLHFIGNQATYIFKNLALNIYQPTIGNLTNNLVEKSLNGSLWTLFWEFSFYILLAISGIFGALEKRKWLLIGFTAIYILCYWLDPCKCTFFLKFFTNKSIAILPYYFLIGSIGFTFRKYIPDSTFLLIFCIILWIVDIKFNPNFPLNPFFLFYILLWLITNLPVKSIERFGDFSYGIYIYHFLIIQTIILASGNYVSAWEIFAITVPISLLMAYISWNMIEKKCLNLKNIFNGR
ncbi:acyltransferase family protein [Pedobacter miscanthi]|uniref:Acyltransferase 3 domain-containing protein n=1 Tax=Pedobacter miscanthi TaxID=2259170 RepID=A0A366L7Z9_9SPHI|nr:acyltransferase [Pedobacter miscanthi]RBQ10005.1 hypothetical protein DRW42_06090 [Pedobacter miscanthi]